MREVEGFTNEIIAEKMGVSIRTIERRIQLEKLYARAVYSKATLERK
jgi:DNA-directed RNA polymerase specialized sigma24 family protein